MFDIIFEICIYIHSRIRMYVLELEYIYTYVLLELEYTSTGIRIIKKESLKTQQFTDWINAKCSFRTDIILKVPADWITYWKKIKNTVYKRD